MVKYATRALFAVAVVYIMTLIQDPDIYEFSSHRTPIPTSVTACTSVWARLRSASRGSIRQRDWCCVRHVRSPAMALLGGVRVHSLLRRVLDSLVSPHDMQIILAFARTLNVTKRKCLFFAARPQPIIFRS